MRLEVNGQRATDARLVVANGGPWFCDLDLAEAGDFSGPVQVRLGDLTCQGTVDPAQSGTFDERTRVRVVAGAGGWGRLLDRKAYHNDAGVRALVVAQDAARACGETLGDFEGADRLGVDYVRSYGTASRTLEDAAKGVPWWVDYNGVTHVKPRTEADPELEAYDLMNYNPRERVAEIAVDDPSVVSVGMQLVERFDQPQTIRSLEMVLTQEAFKVRAWLGGSEVITGRLAGLFRAAARRATDDKIFGSYRYRVFGMSGDRVNLQIVNAESGLPDILDVTQWHGVPSAHANLAAGAEVMVMFEAGDRSRPYIASYVGKGGPGHVADLLQLGGDTTNEASAKNDAVEVTIPPMVFVGTINGQPATGVVTPTLPNVPGVITTGSSKVGIAK
jgi:hypothetical protein